MSTKKITINDVASRAGVSYQTVSRVLNNRPDVSDVTRSRVLRVIEELNYRPSAIARSLVSSKTNTLGLITSELTPYFFTQLITGAEAIARRQGYFLMLACTENQEPQQESESEYIRLFTERHIEGLYFVYTGEDVEPVRGQIESILHQGVPVVTGSHPLYESDLNVSLVDVDNVDGGYQATRALIQAGHRCIAMITGPLERRVTQQRSYGYRQALEEAGIPYDPALVVSGSLLHAGGYQAAQILLNRNISFTGIFGHNDEIAIGAMAALYKAGRRIPDDVAIVGYDDIPSAAYSFPSLTTIRQPMQAVGDAAIKLLLDLLGNPTQERKKILFKPALVRRDSC